MSKINNYEIDTVKVPTNDILEDFLNGKWTLEEVQYLPPIEDIAIKRYLQLTRQEPQDLDSLIDLLKEFTSYGNKEYTQTIVDTGGQKLIKAIYEQQDFIKIIQNLTLHLVNYTAKYCAKDHDFIIKSSNRGHEYSHKIYQEVKEKSKTIINEHKEICAADSNKAIKDLDHVRYVVSKKGDLYININDSNPYNHTCFLKGKPGSELFGFGKPVACGGYISIQDGKITAIDNHSGHYKTSFDQLKVILHYFKQKGILADHIKIEERISDFGKNEYAIDEMDLSDKIIGDILDNYAEIPY